MSEENTTNEKSSSLYEMMLILPGDLGESQIEKALKEVKGLLDEHGVEITNEDVWGVRDLAYTIKKQDSGYYIVWNITIDPLELKGLEKSLNINQSVLRYLVMKIPKHYETKTLEEYLEIAEQEEIEIQKAKDEKKKGFEKKPVVKKVAPKKPEPKPEPKKEEVKEEKVEEVKEEEVKEEEVKKEEPKKKEEEKTLDDFDEKLKNLIDDPDISL